MTLIVTSGTAIVTNGTATGTITDDDRAAGAPTGLTAATGSGVGELDLSWTAPSDTGVLNGADPAAVTGYQYRLAESSGALPSAPWTTAGTATNYTVSGLAGGTAYYFQVRALNGVTPEGEASTEARGTPVDQTRPPAPRRHLSPRRRTKGQTTTPVVPPLARTPMTTHSHRAARSERRRRKSLQLQCRRPQSRLRRHPPLPLPRRHNQLWRQPLHPRRRLIAGRSLSRHRPPVQRPGQRQLSRQLQRLHRRWLRRLRRRRVGRKRTATCPHGCGWSSG